MITWITGNSGSGKSTLAKKLQKIDGGIILDGDDLRRVWTIGYSRDDRIEHNLRAAKLAMNLEKQGLNVIVATICPYKELRDRIKAMTGCRFIYLDGGKQSSDQYPYEGVF